jgi:predicted RNase H-like HicB family nuclease
MGGSRIAAQRLAAPLAVTRQGESGLKYHFRVHRSRPHWAECIELEGCVTQGRTLAELQRNMKEALELYLQEPSSSQVSFPAPASIKSRNGVVVVEVDPRVAFALRVREARLRSRLTQKEAARRLGVRNVYSYQRLERRANPSLSTIGKLKKLFPGLSLDAILAP